MHDQYSFGRRLWAARAAAVAAVAAIGALLLAFGWEARGERLSQPVAQQGAHAWQRLAAPKVVGSEAGVAWTGSSVVVWGGCESVDSGCRTRSVGREYIPEENAWHRTPAAPFDAAHAHAAWTGDEVLFVAIAGEADGWAGTKRGLAYDPVERAWRELPRAPVRLRIDSTSVWTGTELIAFGGGRRGYEATRRGAAYDPAGDEWRTLPPAPSGLNAVHGVWTGKEAIFIGSSLNGRNWAETRQAVGVAYDPATDSWRKLARSALSPQATSADWVGHKLVAWDYLPKSQEYDPRRDTWSSRQRLPFAFSECYPASAVVAELVFAYYCGAAALYDVSANEWTRIGGGPLRREVRTGSGHTKLWRFAELIEADDALYVLAEGITVRSGTPCLGCPGAPVSFWRYAPPTAPR